MSGSKEGRRARGLGVGRTRGLLWGTLRALRLAVVGWGLGGQARAQELPARESVEAFQAWFGVVSQMRLTDRSSVRNDVQFIPRSFYLLRTGYTFHVADFFQITVGYAYLGLPVGDLTVDLKRSEHRPWGQIAHSDHVTPNLRLLHRVRYDVRHRQRVEDGALVEGFGITHRLRYMASLRYAFERFRFAHHVLPYLALSNEVLLNFGEEVVYNHFDQNRFLAMAGLSIGPVSVQAGYIHRYLQLPAGNRYVTNHILAVWMFHTIDVRKRRVLGAEEER